MRNGGNWACRFSELDVCRGLMPMVTALHIFTHLNVSQNSTLEWNRWATKRVYAFQNWSLILIVQSLCYYPFIRSLSFAFGIITMSTLESHSPATYLGSSSSIPCLQHSNCLVNQVPEGVCTHAFYRKRGRESRFKKLWLQFKMRFLVGTCEWCFQVKWFTTGHVNLLTV